MLWKIFLCKHQMIVNKLHKIINNIYLYKKTEIYWIKYSYVFNLLVLFFISHKEKDNYFHLVTVFIYLFFNVFKHPQKRRKILWKAFFLKHIYCKNERNERKWLYNVKFLHFLMKIWVWNLQNNNFEDTTISKLIF